MQSSYALTGLGKLLAASQGIYPRLLSPRAADEVGRSPRTSRRADEPLSLWIWRVLTSGQIMDRGALVLQSKQSPPRLCHETESFDVNELVWAMELCHA